MVKPSVWIVRLVLLLLAYDTLAWIPSRETSSVRRTIVFRHHADDKDTENSSYGVGRIIDENTSMVSIWPLLSIPKPLLVDAEIVRLAQNRLNAAAPVDYEIGFRELVSSSGPDDDCPIPPEYKQIADDHEVQDVWEYLGLKRVRPLE